MLQLQWHSNESTPTQRLHHGGELLFGGQGPAQEHFAPIAINQAKVAEEKIQSKNAFELQPHIVQVQPLDQSRLIEELSTTHHQLIDYRNRGVGHPAEHCVVEGSSKLA